MKRKRRLGKTIETVKALKFDYNYALLLKAFDEVCETDETCHWQTSKSKTDKEKVIELLQALDSYLVDEGETLIPVE